MPARSSLVLIVRALALVLVLVATSRPAAAQVLHVEGEAEGVGGCNLVSAEIVRWTPADGPPAAFLAGTWTTTAGNVIVLLGASAAGFWTAEIDAGSDACEDCRVLHLVRTGWFVGVSVSDRPGLRFGVRYEVVMCWCHDEWHGYALRT